MSTRKPKATHIKPNDGGVFKSVARADPREGQRRVGVCCHDTSVHATRCDAQCRTFAVPLAVKACAILLGHSDHELSVGRPWVSREAHGHIQRANVSNGGATADGIHEHSGQKGWHKQRP